MGQGRQTQRSISDPVYPHYHKIQMLALTNISVGGNQTPAV